MTLMSKTNPEDFALNHPAGKIGQALDPEREIDAQGKQPDCFTASL